MLTTTIGEMMIESKFKEITRARMAACREVLASAYAALDGDSNDAEHDALNEAVELIEDLFTGAGGELPPREDEDDRIERRGY